MASFIAWVLGNLSYLLADHMQRIIVKILILSVTCIAHSSVLAEGRYNWTQSEIAVLPSYCQGKLTGKKTAVTFNKKDWGHGHHYCYALVFLSRARTKQIPNLGLAISNFDYVDKAWSQSFILRPQMHLYLGEALQMQGDNVGAAQNFMKAIRLKPKHPAGYLALSKQYEKMGAKDQAITTLEDGLKRVPESKSKPLQRKLDKLKK
jgi:tetratricopeptide (TPR) repeat protein